MFIKIHIINPKLKVIIIPQIHKNSKMAQYMSRIESLAEAEGIMTNPMKQMSLVLFKNDIDNLEFENNAKEGTLIALDERLDIAQAELKAERDLCDKLEVGIIDDLDTMIEKNLVLKQYIDTMESGPEFEINELHNRVHKKYERLYSDIKTFIERARAVNSEVTQLRELQNKCDELKKSSEAES